MIAFQRAEREDLTNAEIWVIRADGSGQRNLTRSAADDGVPRWSPDGRTIVFQRRRSRSRSELWRVSLDAGPPHRLVSDAVNEYDVGHSWSPDGRRIAFFRAAPERKADLYVMGADGGDQRKLATTRNPANDPVWSPDGSRIYFSGFGIEAAVVGRRDQPKPIQVGESFDLSPDGTKVVFMCGYAICVVGADGVGQRQLTRSRRCDYFPSWSPDGRKIGFLRDPDCEGGPFDVVLMRGDGSNRRALTRGSSVLQYSSVAWRPSPGQGA